MCQLGVQPMFTLLNTRRICYLRGSIFRTGAARRVPFSRAAGLVLAHRLRGILRACRGSWGYTNDFERQKYEQTLALLDGMQIGRALEFKKPRATLRRCSHPALLNYWRPTSPRLRSCAPRTADCNNISYQRLDLVQDPITGPFDLIVCSEVLYYLEDLAILERLRERLPAP